jgi:hypothetical protein
MVTVPKIPDFMAVYSSDLDSAGHDNGAESPIIGSTLAESDRQLGRLVQATKDVGIYGEVAWLLTSDHSMTSWDRTLIPQVLKTVTEAGYVLEIVTPGRSPASATEVIIFPNGMRIGDFTLRGNAATAEAKGEIKGALEGMEEIETVLDEPDLDRLRASEKLGDLVAEAKPPWGFALSEPEPGEERGLHSRLSEIELPLLLAGAGIRRGGAARGRGSHGRRPHHRAPAGRPAAGRRPGPRPHRVARHARAAGHLEHETEGGHHQARKQSQSRAAPRRRAGRLARPLRRDLRGPGPRECQGPAPGRRAGVRHRRRFPRLLGRPEQADL